MTNLSDYDLGRTRGRADYRTGGDYTPQPGSPDWSTGYADGWTHAADEATAAVGHTAACRLAWGEGIAAHHQPHSASEPERPNRAGTD